MFGYHRKLLRVDLSNRKIEVEELDEAVIRKYIGGLGLEAKILYEETGPETNPLSAENILLAVTGPYTGTGIPSSGRHHVVSRSPLTGLFGESNVGGSWAVHCKKAGFDGVVVKGTSEIPVYLWIQDGKAEIRDAKPIWGKDSYESADWLANMRNTGNLGHSLARGSKLEPPLRIGLDHAGDWNRGTPRPLSD